MSTHGTGSMCRMCRHLMENERNVDTLTHGRHMEFGHVSRNIPLRRRAIMALYDTLTHDLAQRNIMREMAEMRKNEEKLGGNRDIPKRIGNHVSMCRESKNYARNSEASS